MKTPERSGDFIVNFEQISQFFLGLPSQFSK